MNNQLMTFDYRSNQIQFQKKVGTNISINATQMAKIYSKNPKDFFELDSTANFINSCLKIENQKLLCIKSIDDLFTSRQKSGTWMHRVLALKFAAWLNADFELWVYSTIDNILSGDFSEVLEFKEKMNSLQEEKRELESQFNRNYLKLKDNKYFIIHLDITQKLKSINSNIQNLHRKTIESIYTQNLFQNEDC